MLAPLALGPYSIEPLALAPMAGVTDRPFRQLCRDWGAGHVVSEMVTSDSELWDSRKSRWRLDHVGEPGPITVQIVGHDADQLAEAARLNVARGAHVIDINMGCPMKKVCNKLAGSALMRDEALVGRLLHAVVSAVDVPVTLKMRTGWSPEERNAVTLAQLAESLGIALITIHGRTRADRFMGEAEYDTIAAVKQAVRIPVLANGDIDSPEKARQVLKHTGADGIMIGRAAQGQPWLFQAVRDVLMPSPSGPVTSLPDLPTRHRVMHDHVAALHAFYGAVTGVRMARKHVGWYAQHLPHGHLLKTRFHLLAEPEEQLACLDHFFHFVLPALRDAA